MASQACLNEMWARWGWSPAPGWELDGFALEGGLLGVGEGVLGLEGGDGLGGLGLCAGVGLGGLFAHGLELLGLAAEAADLEGAGFGDEVVHGGIFSWAGR